MTTSANLETVCIYSIYGTEITHPDHWVPIYPLYSRNSRTFFCRFQGHGKNLIFVDPKPFLEAISLMPNKSGYIKAQREFMSLSTGRTHDSVLESIIDTPTTTTTTHKGKTPPTFFPLGRKNPQFFRPILVFFFPHCLPPTNSDYSINIISFKIPLGRKMTKKRKNASRGTKKNFFPAPDSKMFKSGFGCVCKKIF